MPLFSILSDNLMTFPCLSFTFFYVYGNDNKPLVTGPKGNSEFCFPEILNVPRGEAEGNIEVWGKQNQLFAELPMLLRII